MTIQVELDGSTLPASRTLIGGVMSSISALPMSADGTGSQGGITFDDPDGSLTHRGWSIVKVDEDDDTADPTLFYGTLADRTEKRGTYKDGPGRVIDATLNDSNVFLSLRIIGGDTGSRPEETDTARLAWLLGDASLDGLVQDLGLVTSTGLTLDPLYTQGMTPGEVLSDIASHYGQIFFTYWDQTAEAVGLFFDFADSTTYTCAISISNVLDDITLDSEEVVTGDVYPPFVDGERYVTPEDLYSRVRFKYTGGVVWRSNATTAATFFPEPLRYGSVQVENDRIGKLSTATTFADRFLLAHSTERVTVKFTVRLPSTRVGEVQAGMRISLRFSHLTGFETATWSRIERINRIPVDVFPPAWDVTCECSTAGIKSGYGSGGGSTDPYPTVPPSTEPNIVQQVSGAGNIIMPNPIGIGNTLILATTARGVSILAGGYDFTANGYTACPDGETLDPAGLNPCAVYYRSPTDGTEDQHLGGAVGSVPTQELNGTWYELEGVWAPDTHDKRAAASTTVSTPSISVAANSFNVVVSAQGHGGAYDSVAGTLTYTPAAGWTEDFDAFNPAGGAPNVWNAHRVNTGAGSISGGAVNSGNGGLSGTDYDFAAQIVSFTGGGTTVDPPSPGKKWGPIAPNETPDGATYTFTMPAGYVWADGSLEVFVDDLDQTAAVTSQDGATGTFTLSFAPWGTDTITVFGIP